MTEQNLLEMVSADYEFYYAKLVEIASIDGNDEAHCLCPVHKDSKASMHINMTTGKWHCKACATGGHNIVQLFQFIYGIDEHDAEDELKYLFGILPKLDDETKKFNIKLLHNVEAMSYLEDRKISKDTINKYCIGFDGMRFHIPIRDFSGNLRNVRKHLKGYVDGQEKDISAFKGVGGIRLFPIRNTMLEKIYLFEGEMDALCAMSNGLNAISVTGGAGSWKLEFNKYFIDKEVYICYDIDNTGIQGAKKIASLLAEATSKVFTIDLPKEGLPEHGDFTDYIKLKGIDEFLKLEAKKFDGLTEEEAENAVHEIHLGETTNSFWYNKKVKTTVIPTGKGALFLCPKKVEINCSGNNGDKCDTCAMKKYNCKRVLIIKPDNPRYLQMVRIPDEEQRVILKKMAGIPIKCYAAKLKITEAVNIEQVSVIPEIDYSSTASSSYVSRLVYVVGDMPIEANKPYVIHGLVLPFPKSQESTMLVYKSEATKDNIDSFEITPDIIEQLSAFKANTLEEMKAKLAEKYSDYEAVTRIYKREILFKATDIVYHSAISFKFQGKVIKKGHVNALIYGDTRTGKSETVDNLMNHFRAGDAVGGENVTFAGLVGGVHKIANGEKWGITWKIIPLNDRRLVKIDEFHGMSDEDIGKLSEIISTGIANIQKIHNERTLARTRLLFIANTKFGKHLAEYQYGCLAIVPIMGGHAEDIARLDFAVAIASDDISVREMNQLQSTGKREVTKFTSEMCHNLIMWAWSRKQSDVVFNQDAEDLIIELSEAQVSKYHVSIPLVPPAEQSIKLARVSVAIAAMFFSTDATGNKVIVTTEHVKLAAEFFDEIYSMNSMGFDKYSNYMYSKDRIKDVDEVRAMGISESTKDLLLNIDKLSIQQIGTVFNTADRDYIKDVTFRLLKNNAIKPYGTNLYMKTPAFVKFLCTEKFKDKHGSDIRNSNF